MQGYRGNTARTSRAVWFRWSGLKETSGATFWEVAVVVPWGSFCSKRVFSHLKGVIFEALSGCTGCSPLSQSALFLCNTSEERLTCSWYVFEDTDGYSTKYTWWSNTVILQKKSNSLS